MWLINLGIDALKDEGHNSENIYHPAVANISGEASGKCQIIIDLFVIDMKSNHKVAASVHLSLHTLIYAQSLRSVY